MSFWGNTLRKNYVPFARQSNALQARIKQASLPVEKDLDSFDFSVIHHRQRPLFLMESTNHVLINSSHG